jgi:hypothetical protein
MAVTQRLYPGFFSASLRGTSGTNFNSSTGQLACKIRLYTSANGGHNPADLTTADLGSAVSGTEKSVTVTQTLDTGNERLKFAVSSVTWTTPGTFKYAVISTSNATPELIMHFDFGADQTPLGDFTLSMAADGEAVISFG